MLKSLMAPAEAAARRWSLSPVCPIPQCYSMVRLKLFLALATKAGEDGMWKPRRALREYKGNLAGLACLSPTSSTPAWAWAVCSEYPSSPRTTQPFPIDLMIFVPVASRARTSWWWSWWQHWLHGSLSFGVGDGRGSGFPNPGTVPSSQLRGAGFVCVASNARRQLGLGDSAGRQLMDLGSRSCPRYHT